MSLLHLLADDLVSYMDQAPDGVVRRVMLWLDPEATFRRLMPHLEAILRDRGVALLWEAPAERMQMHLKLELLQGEASQDGRAIAYLPGLSKEALDPRSDGAVPELWGVYEYRFKGCVWGRGAKWKPGSVRNPHTLLTWLLGYGVTTADDKTRRAITKGGSNSLLARYADLKRHSELDEWPRPLRASDVEEALGGDPRERLRALLAAPTNEVKRWKEQDISDMVFARLSDEFGLNLPGQDASAEEIVDTFTSQLALTEAWDAFGRADDFPFRSYLPERSDQQEAAIAFVRDHILSSKILGPLHIQRMRRLEAKFDLTSWADGRKGQPTSLPLLAKKRWQGFLTSFEEAVTQGWRHATAFLVANKEAAIAGEMLPGDETDLGTHWSTMSRLTELIETSERGRVPVSSASLASELADLYARELWRIDAAHVEVLDLCGSSRLEAVHNVADSAYFDFVSFLNDRFSSLLEEEAVWPPPDTSDVSSLRETLWSKPSGRRGVIVIDACRYDLARKISHRIQGEISWKLATLPTITPFGMTALLPLGDQDGRVEFSAGKASIASSTGLKLATREGRKRFLTERVSERKLSVGFVDMADLLSHRSVPSADLLAVFDNSIDEQGHANPGYLPELIDRLVDDVTAAVHILHDAGIATVYVVSDHGFLLVPEDQVDGLGRPELPVAQTLYKNARWAALKPGAPVGDQVFKVPLPLAQEVVLGFPRGLRTLHKAERYLHGGVSLQEAIVGVITSRVSVEPAKLEVEVGVTTDQLSSGTVPVVVRPVGAGGKLPFGVRPLNLVLWVETIDRTRVSDEIALEVRPDAEELRPALYLKEGMGLPEGQELILRAVEVDGSTRRDLPDVNLTLVVGWE